MTDQEYQKAQEDLEEVLDALATKVPSKELGFIREYGEANEMPLGIELLIYWVERKRVPVSDKTHDLIYDLARRFNIDLDRTRQGWPRD